MTDKELLDDAESLVFEDIDGTLKRLEESKERISARLQAVQVDAACKIVHRHKITEPLREGIGQLTGVLNELRGRLAGIQGRMLVSSELSATAKTQGILTYVETYRQELFEQQMGAALLTMEIEEQEEHLQNVRKRLGEEPTVLELDRAVAVIEMHNKLSEQLVEVARLQSWFSKKKADAAT